MPAYALIVIFIHYQGPSGPAPWRSRPRVPHRRAQRPRPGTPPLPKCHRLFTQADRCPPTRSTIIVLLKEHNSVTPVNGLASRIPTSSRIVAAGSDCGPHRIGCICSTCVAELACVRFRYTYACHAHAHTSVFRKSVLISSSRSMHTCPKGIMPRRSMTPTSTNRLFF